MAKSKKQTKVNGKQLPAPFVLGESKLCVLTRKLVRDRYETIIKTHLKPYWIEHVKGDVRGRCEFSGTIRKYFWSPKFIPQKLEDAIYEILQQTAKTCPKDNLRWYVKEAGIILKSGLVNRVYDYMVHLDQQLRTKGGNLKSVKRVEVYDDKVPKMHKLIEDCVTAVNLISVSPKETTTTQIGQGTSGGNAGDKKTTNGKIQLSKVPTLELLKQSESHTLEFKEIPECNTQQNRKNNDVLLTPLKTIAGFLNAEGGILLIGVDNSGKIVGIEPYLNTMKQGNNDTFEQQIRNCLRDRLEPYPIGKVKVSFEKFMEGTVCRIDVQADKEPVNLDNEVYVRDGNTTQLLKGRQLTDWIQKRGLPTALPSGK